MIVLGDLKDCDACQDPTKKRVGTAFDTAGPGSVSPVWDCENARCKKEQNIHARFLFYSDYASKGGGGHE